MHVCALTQVDDVVIFYQSSKYLKESVEVGEFGRDLQLLYPISILHLLVLDLICKGPFIILSIRKREILRAVKDEYGLVVGSHLITGYNFHDDVLVLGVSLIVKDGQNSQEAYQFRLIEGGELELVGDRDHLIYYLSYFKFSLYQRLVVVVHLSEEIYAANIVFEVSFGVLEEVG